MGKKVFYVALFFSILRLVLLFYHNPSFVLNPDEESNYDLALNKVLGHDYSHKVDNVYVKSAFHSSFNVFLYEYLAHLHIDKTMLVVFFNCLSGMLFGISVVYMYCLSQYFLKENMAWIATWLYCLYPSVFYYIGTLYAYENIVLPFVIISVYYFIKMFKNEDLVKWVYLLLIIISLISVMLRPQTLPLCVLMYGLHLIIFVFKNNYRMVLFSTLFFIALGLVHIPVLKKNHRMFGAYVLNTQFGFELLQGHNPTARGSWMGAWKEKGNPLYEYAHENIVGLDAMDEYEASNARKELAISWATNNPLKMIVLYMRKIAIYLLPINYEVLPYSNFYNPINLIVHLLFCLGIVRIWFSNDRNLTYVWITIPIISSLLITIIFFMGARWRYYAEPFMIIYALLGLQYLQNKYFVNKPQFINT